MLWCSFGVRLVGGLFCCLILSVVIVVCCTVCCFIDFGDCCFALGFDFTVGFGLLYTL